MQLATYEATPELNEWEKHPRTKDLRVASFSGIAAAIHSLAAPGVFINRSEFYRRLGVGNQWHDHPNINKKKRRARRRISSMS